MLRGLSTIGFQADDLNAASAWYGEVLGIAPYFVTPAYIEFRLGDYQHELGILKGEFRGQLGMDTATPVVPNGTVAYWHVDDIEAAYGRLLDLGATAVAPPRDFGQGFIGASVRDPFGNLLGVRHNPHYLEVLHSRDSAG